jgi:hypothetical protein
VTQAGKAPTKPTRRHKSSFGIENPRDFYDLVVAPQYIDFTKNNGSPRLAILAAIVEFHMYEWANGQPFRKTTSGFGASLNEMFCLAKGIVNGSKHFRHKITTRRQPGFSQDFGGGFARPLIIVRDDKSEISADDLLRALDLHWKMKRVAGEF